MLTSFAPPSISQKCFLFPQRAHTLICRSFQPFTSAPDSLPASVDPSALLATLVETAEPPPFSLVAKENGRGDRDEDGDW